MVLLLLPSAYVLGANSWDVNRSQFLQPKFCNLPAPAYSQFFLSNFRRKALQACVVVRWFVSGSHGGCHASQFAEDV